MVGISDRHVQERRSIAEEHVYDSSIYDLQNQDGIFKAMVMVVGQRMPRIPIDMIGRSYVGFRAMGEASKTACFGGRRSESEYTTTSLRRRRATKRHNSGHYRI